MAVRHYCDILDNEPASPVTFTWDAVEYRIDLSEAAKKTATISELLTHATPVAKAASATKTAKRTGTTDSADTAAKDWLIEHGHRKGRQGKISAEQRALYEARKK